MAGKSFTQKIILNSRPLNFIQQFVVDVADQLPEERDVEFNPQLPHTRASFKIQVTITDQTTVTTTFRTSYQKAIWLTLSYPTRKCNWFAPKNLRKVHNMRPKKEGKRSPLYFEAQISKWKAINQLTEIRFELQRKQLRDKNARWRRRWGLEHNTLCCMYVVNTPLSLYCHWSAVLNALLLVG